MPAKVDLLQSGALASIPWLRHGFSTRAGGVSLAYGRPSDLNLGFTDLDEPARVLENRRRVIFSAAAPSTAYPWALATTRQVHSSTTLIVTPESLQSSAPRPEADGLLTAVPGLFLAMLTADCVPVLVADPRHRVVAAFHAGWRGTAGRIVEKGIATMVENFQSDPAELVGAIGPSIGPCCYAVGDEVTTQFRQQFDYAPALFSEGRLDLWEANRRQLLASGLAPENIDLLARCTACDTTEGAPTFFSHRAQQGITGRLMSLIGIAPA